MEKKKTHSATVQCTVYLFEHLEEKYICMHICLLVSRFFPFVFFKMAMPSTFIFVLYFLVIRQTKMALKLYKISHCDSRRLGLCVFVFLLLKYRKDNFQNDANSIELTS